MLSEAQHYFERAIERLAQSDPLLKLLQEVRLGRMKATDPGLGAVTEAWLHTYRQILEAATALDELALRRLDPYPRLAVLIDAAMVKPDQPAVVALRSAFDHALARTRTF